jgi:hypothetical protein
VTVRQQPLIATLAPILMLSTEPGGNLTLNCLKRSWLSTSKTCIKALWFESVNGAGLQHDRRKSARHPTRRASLTCLSGSLNNASKYHAWLQPQVALWPMVRHSYCATSEPPQPQRAAAQHAANPNSGLFSPIQALRSELRNLG